MGMRDENDGFLEECGPTDFDGEDVAVLRDELGRMSIVPRSLTRLSPDARQSMRRIQDCCEMIRSAQDELDRQVREAREEHRVSWNAVGWAVGIAGQNARKRWGVV